MKFEAQNSEIYASLSFHYGSLHILWDYGGVFILFINDVCLPVTLTLI